MFYRTPFLIACVVMALTQSIFASQPNIIIILTDDMGYNDLGVQTYPNQTNFYPNSGPAPNFSQTPVDADWPQPNEARLLTPALDSLGADGLRMTRFYSTPICSPSRATLLTGRYQKRMDITTVFHPTSDDGVKGLNTEEVTLPELLRQYGYATGMIGKWHLGYRPDEPIPFQMMPIRHGFEEFYGVPHSNDISFFHLVEDETILMDSVQGPLEQAKLTWRYTERALDYIQRKTAEDKPFFLYLAHSQLHIPCYPSDTTFTNADGTTWPQFLGQSGVSNYYDVLMETDHSTQRILDQLDDLGIADNTIVIFTSDNGAWLLQGDAADDELFSVGSNYPLRRGKQWTDEGGVRVPFLVRWPDQIPAGTVSDQVAGLQDLLPTLVNAAGGTVPSDRTIDGIDIGSIWDGSESYIERTMALFFFDLFTQVIKDNWKLTNDALFDLDTDIQELNDLDGDPAFSAKLAEMEALRDSVDNSIATNSSVRGEFTAYEVELSADSVSINEGSTATFDVRLSDDPGEAVTVDTAFFSGDSDISVSGGSSLNFSSANWDQWQTVTVFASQDVDADSDGATLRVTCSAITAIREVFAFEVDDDAAAPAVASLVWPKIDPVFTDASTVMLVGEGSVQGGVLNNPVGSTYSWHKVSGPGDVTFSDPDSERTSVAFSMDGAYSIRLKADYPGSSAYDSIDFAVNVGQLSGSTALEYSPTLAYDATADTDGDTTWENLVSSGSRDWTLSSWMARTVSDPAPNLSFIDSAWVFPGGTTDGGSSTSLDAFSNADASIEVWFQPTLPMAGNQVIWESGGDVGSSLTLVGNMLTFAVDQSSGGVAQVALTPNAARDNFVHCVGVVDLANSQIRLYVDGVLEDSASISGVTDWCGGGSSSGVGNLYQSISTTPTTTINELGGNNQLTGSFEGFDGNISILRVYESALGATEIADLSTGPNRSPVVAAGGDQSVAFKDGVVLDGTVTVNGLDASGALNIVWQKYDGPGIVSFSDFEAIDTTASFDLPGGYTLWLEADDAEVKVVDDLSVQVAPLTFLEWKGDFVFPLNQDGPGDNPDSDTLVNIWEWVLGQNPVIADAFTSGIDYLYSKEPGIHRLQLQFDVPRDRSPDLFYEGGASLPISADITALGVVSIEAISGTTNRYTFTYDVPDSNDTFFIRAGAVE